MQAAELAFAGAFEQARLVRERIVTAREVVEATLEMIASNEPSLNAFRTVLAEQALSEAERLDATGLAASAPLAGVPVAIKDDTDVAGQLTCWGTGMSGAPRTDDAPVVATATRRGDRDRQDERAGDGPVAVDVLGNSRGDEEPVGS